MITSFTSCPVVSRHAFNDFVFFNSALTNIGIRQDRLMDLVEDVADEDPFAALRLLQVCGVQCFGHIITSVPPPLVRDFATARDEAVASTLVAIQQEPPPQDSTHSYRLALAAHLSPPLLETRLAAILERSFELMTPYINAS